jgi:hypothetical protein
MACKHNIDIQPLDPPEPEKAPDAFDDLDADHIDWILRNLELDDPVELRRHDLRGWAEAAGFQNIDVGNLGEPDYWEMRCNRGTNAECTTAAEAERWVGFIARGCGCRIEPGQFVAIVHGDQFAARFRLQPGEQPVPC